ncbi:MAG: phenylalanine--tRNA ligase subunit beta [Gammaproteobacteria bacterium]|nr:phenylalanine--tRNA ligase subunit beta [Gammaproteobacteria bacterium]
MKVSELWLREWVDPPADTAALADRLTLAGFEVEAVRPCGAGLNGVVVGMVRECAPVPQSDHLTLCRVDAGQGRLHQVVCGAPNVRVGGRYPFAAPGATLPGGRSIGATLIRGVQSEGMLCSEAELGLGDAAGGLLELDGDAAPGTGLGSVLALDDNVLEIALTPNRGDCMSIAGLARETAALYRIGITAAPAVPAAAASDRRRSVRLAAAAGCPRYAGRIIDDADLTRPAPLWLRERLRRADIRSINAAVDIANYVMLELGQPMHAFDDAKLNGDIVVRFAHAGETLTFLDNEQRDLDADMLVITDAGGVVAMAGVMGGLHTSVTPSTRSLFLESAHFAPDAIMGRARRLGLQTDAGQRFERGVDPELAARALERATTLLLESCGGRPGPLVDTRDDAAFPRKSAIPLRSGRVRRVLGAELAPEAIEGILRRLGLEPAPAAGGWSVGIPAFRFDLSLEADLIEEIARVHGYDRLPSRKLGGRVGMHSGGPDPRLREWRRALAARGYQEAITYSFTDTTLQEQFAGPGDTLSLRNPIASDLGVMRQSLLPGLLGALSFNRKRQQERVRLFEIGRGYRLDREAIRQPLLLAGISCGTYFPEQWDISTRDGDFHDLKGDVEELLAVAGFRNGCRWRPVAKPGLHPGQSAEIILENQPIGYIATLHPGALKGLDLKEPVLFFELDLEQIPARKAPSFRPISRFPSVRRDIAVVVARELAVARVLDVVTEAAGEVLTNLELFDVYQGEGIDLGKKSLALGLTFQATSLTLTDEAVDSVIESVLNSLKEKYGGTLREKS